MRQQFQWNSHILCHIALSHSRTPTLSQFRFKLTNAATSGKWQTLQYYSNYTKLFYTNQEQVYNDLLWLFCCSPIHPSSCLLWILYITAATVCGFLLWLTIQVLLSQPLHITRFTVSDKYFPKLSSSYWTIFNHISQIDSQCWFATTYAASATSADKLLWSDEAPLSSTQRTIGFASLSPTLYKCHSAPQFPH